MLDCADGMSLQNPFGNQRAPDVSLAVVLAIEQRSKLAVVRCTTSDS